MQQLIIWSCGWRYGYKGCCPRLQWRFPKCGRIFSNIVGQFSHRNVLRATWYILHWTHHYLRWLNRNQARNRWNLKFWTSKASSDRVLDTVWPSGTSGVCKQHEDFHHNLRYCVNREPALIFLLLDLVLFQLSKGGCHSPAAHRLDTFPGMTAECGRDDERQVAGERLPLIGLAVVSAGFDKVKVRLGTSESLLINVSFTDLSFPPLCSQSQTLPRRTLPGLAPSGCAHCSRWSWTSSLFSDLPHRASR